MAEIKISSQRANEDSPGGVTPPLLNFYLYMDFCPHTKSAFIQSHRGTDVPLNATSPQHLAFLTNQSGFLAE